MAAFVTEDHPGASLRRLLGTMSQVVSSAWNVLSGTESVPDTTNRQQGRHCWPNKLTLSGWRTNRRPRNAGVVLQATPLLFSLAAGGGGGGARAGPRVCDNALPPPCRYCFQGEDDGPLIEPCKCKGSVKYAHASCLAQWQRRSAAAALARVRESVCCWLASGGLLTALGACSVYIMQPTHPAFYERDERQFVCSVCKGEFTQPPPSRAEMMLSFTGPELASLISVGCLIGAFERLAASALTSSVAEHVP